MTISFALSHQIISRTDSMILASGSKNYVTAQFDLLTEDWTAPITAIFNEYTVVLDENNQCLVPWEVLANPGKVAVSAFCGDLHTAISVLVPVHPGGYIDGQTPQLPTPGVYEQLAGMVQTAVDTANDVKERADAGEFNGKDAPQIDDTQASPDNPWSGAKVDAELGKYAPLESALTVYGIGSDHVSLSPTIAWKMQGMKLFGRTTQDGTPTPDAPVPLISAGEGGSVEVTVSDGAEQSQALTVSTPNGLHGIPVDSGGNYTDSTGQQWICDEIDFARGVYIQRLLKKRLNPNGWLYSSATNRFYKQDQDYITSNVESGYEPCKGLCTHFIAAKSNYSTADKVMMFVNSTTRGFAFRYKELAGDVELFNNFLTENDVYIIGVKKEPAEIALTQEELEAYSALVSYNGTTNVIAQGCGVGATALANQNEYISGLIHRIAALESAATNI